MFVVEFNGEVRAFVDRKVSLVVSHFQPVGTLNVPFGYGSFSPSKQTGSLLKGVSPGCQDEVRLNVTSQRLVLLDLSVFGYLAFKDLLPSSTS
jgi:hypothetical protein